MRTGLAVSAVFHLVLIGWGLISLSAFEPLDASDFEALPIEFVEIDEESSTPLGIRDAEVAEDPAPNDPTDQVAEIAQPAPEPPAEDPVKPTPPPPPPSPDPEPVPDQADPNQALQDAEPLPDPTEADAAPELDPAAEETPKPENVLDAPKEVAVATPLPRVRPPHQAPPSEARERSDDIAALLDTTKPSSAPAESDRQAAIGAVTGSPFKQLSVSEIDALRAKLAACWDIPPTRVDPAELRVKVKVFLSQGGTLLRTPEVVEYKPTQIGQVAAESALRAVQRCAPFNLPVEKYDSWKEIIMTFDPREMFGG
ncbi:MAG: hypothetical protein KDJ86_10220 [Bauldia sp.]|uniref:hypothetical protein n=1 Tax=Bauldia sp. TaxID=2575872 RepID=UPI001DB630CF|nr:hypothetical protein [Bauldia sp.]MCB1496150.1 hypothetical protein [Bauldia sp.]